MPPRLSQCLVSKRSFAWRDASGFSLVEVVIAVGVTAFALVALLGLLPAGLQTFKGTINTATGSQIAQRVFNDMQVSDWSTLAATNRFFDEQGNELTNSNSAFCIYWVQVRVTNATTGSSSTSTRFTGNTSTNLMTVSIIVANNPGGANTNTSAVFSSTNPNAFTFTTLMGRNR
jgi:uncharacterized protein (TIGR02598 family)